jgi:hypothetical protein
MVLEIPYKVLSIRSIRISDLYPSFGKHQKRSTGWQREPLEGVVEVDQAEIPFRADNGFFDPVKSGKILTAGAVEVIDRGTNQAKPRRKRAKYLDTRSGRIRLAAIPDNSAASIEAFVRANVKIGTTLLTDRHRSIPGSPITDMTRARSARWPAISCCPGVVESSR